MSCLWHTLENQVIVGMRPATRRGCRGASEWTDYAHNIVSMWRNKQKTEALEAARESKQNTMVIDQETEDAKIIVRKQRLTGTDSFTKLWFNPDSKLYGKTRDLSMV